MPNARETMPMYLKIGSAFHLGKGLFKGFMGSVIASQDAFYLIANRSAAQTAWSASGGALGGMIGGMIQGRAKQKPLLKPSKHIRELDITELPEEIVSHPDWTVKSKSGRVIIVTRKAIRSVHYSYWRWGIFLDTPVVQIPIEPPFFGRQKVLDFLEQADWC